MTYRKRLTPEEIHKLINQEPDIYYDKRIPHSERAIIQRILRFDHEIERKKELKKLVKEELKKKGVPQDDDDSDDFEWFCGNENFVDSLELEADNVSEPSVIYNNKTEENKSDRMLSRKKQISKFLHCLDTETQESFEDEREENYFANAVNVGLYASRTPLCFPMVPERTVKKVVIEPQDCVDLNTRIVDYEEKPTYSNPYKPPIKDLRKILKDKGGVELKKIFDTYSGSLSYEHRLEQSKMLMTKQCLNRLLRP